MPKKEHITRYSVKELAKMKSRTNWKKAMAASQVDVERLADEEEGALPKGWQSTVMLGIPEAKQDIHIRLDADIIRWFKSHGHGYQTRINAVLRSFVQARGGWGS